MPPSWRGARATTAGSYTPPKPVTEKVSDLAGAAKEKATEVKDAAVDKAGELKDKATDAKDAAKDKAADAKDAVDEKVADAEDTVGDAIDESDDTTVPALSETSEGADLSTPNLDTGSTPQPPHPLWGSRLFVVPTPGPPNSGHLSA